MKLKPCPFCGGEAVFAREWEIFNKNYVHCLECRVQIGFEHTREDAIEAWNRRSTIKPNLKEDPEEDENTKQ